MGPFSFRNLVIPYAKWTFSKTTSSRFGHENGTKTEPKMTPFGAPFLILFWIQFWTSKKLDFGPKTTPEKSGTFTAKLVPNRYLSAGLLLGGPLVAVAPFWEALGTLLGSFGCILGGFGCLLEAPLPPCPERNLAVGNLDK